MASHGAVLLNRALKERFAPVLRGEGFRGSGRTYRRIRGDLVHVLNVQGSKYGGEFAVNLGVHLSFLPDAIGNEANLAKIAEMSCEFRGRMRESGADQWWRYRNDEKGTARAVDDMAIVWTSHGKSQFEKLGEYPRDFSRLTPEDLRAGAYDFGGLGSTEARLALTFARIRAHEGRADEARAFVKHGLSIAGGAYILANRLREVENAL